MLIYAGGAEASGANVLTGAPLAPRVEYCAFFIKVIERRDQFEYYVYRRVKALTPALE
jgi:hypothetical protein